MLRVLTRPQEFEKRVYAVVYGEDGEEVFRGSTICDFWMWFVCGVLLEEDKWREVDEEKRTCTYYLEVSEDG